MGHPGAPNHDHHRSLWLAHSDLLGIDFWSEHTTARIEQSQWYAIEETDQYATLALELIWRDGHDPRPLLRQDLFATIRPVTKSTAEAPFEDWTLELQADFRTDAQGIAFRKSNFGILGLRVSQELSVVFGSGKITGSDGREGEHELFGQPNRWIDISGPLGKDAQGREVKAGVALVDHARNPGHGTHPHAAWHVRDDGWMGPSLSRHANVELPTNSTLRCRYLLVVHAGECNSQSITQLADEFDARPARQIDKGTRQHHQFEISQAKAEA
jgi:hypothetical protein